MRKILLILIILGFFYYPTNIQAKVINFIGIDEVQDQKAGNQVRIRGIVSVLPNTIGKQFFYITNNTNSVQIYSYKKNFPNLNIGNVVEVRGEISVSNNTKRIKTKILADIQVLNENMEVIVNNIECSELSQQNINSLVHVEGNVLEKKGQKIYIDDGTGEVMIYIKVASNISLDNIEVMDRLIINGIVERIKEEFRIVPRDQNDILVQKKEIPKEEGEILIKDKKGNIEIAPRNNTKTKFILIVLITITLITIIRWGTKKRKFFFERK